MVWGIHSVAWITWPWTPRHSQFVIGYVWLGSYNFFDLVGHCGQASFVVRWTPFTDGSGCSSQLTKKPHEPEPLQTLGILGIPSPYVTIMRLLQANSTQLSLVAFPSQLPDASLLHGAGPPVPSPRCWLPTVYRQAIHSVMVDQGM